LARAVSKPTRLFFVADLHGSERCFRKFLNAASVYKANVLLIGGDISAKTITPLFPENAGWAGTYLGARRWVPEGTGLERFEADLKTRGTLPYRTTRDAWTETLADRAKGDALFRDLALAQLRDWLRLAETRLKGSGVRTLVGLGNDDLDEMETVLGASEYVELTDREILLIDDHELLTLPYSNPTPWGTNRELPEEEIARRLDELSRRLEAPSRAIFNVHVPPMATPLDMAPKLDSRLTKVMTPGGEPELVHVGSPSLRAAIERVQPLLGLHGHIHESKGFVTIGRTGCLNPGSGYPEGVLQGAVIDLDRDRVRSHVFTTG
jgi:Icc-related predicted phosphoesterase